MKDIVLMIGYQNVAFLFLKPRKRLNFFPFCVATRPCGLYYPSHPSRKRMLYVKGFFFRCMQRVSILFDVVAATPQQIENHTFHDFLYLSIQQILFLNQVLKMVLFFALSNAGSSIFSSFVCHLHRSYQRHNRSRHLIVIFLKGAALVCLIYSRQTVSFCLIRSHVVFFCPIFNFFMCLHQLPTLQLFYPHACQSVRQHRSHKSAPKLLQLNNVSFFLSLFCIFLFSSKAISCTRPDLYSPPAPCRTLAASPHLSRSFDSS
jgi:hypothetical protein